MAIECPTCGLLRFYGPTGLSAPQCMCLGDHAVKSRLFDDDTHNYIADQLRNYARTHAAATPAPADSGLEALRKMLQEAVDQLKAAAPAPAPTEVWEASGKTGRMLFPTEPEARAWVAQFPASVAGGFEVYPVTVYRYPLAGQEKNPT